MGKKLHQEAYAPLFAGRGIQTLNRQFGYNAIGIKHSLDEHRTPGRGDDKSQGYGPGSIFINRDEAEIHMCVDNTAGQAKWLTIAGPDQLTKESGPVEAHPAVAIDDDPDAGHIESPPEDTKQGEQDKNDSPAIEADKTGSPDPEQIAAEAQALQERAYQQHNQADEAAGRTAGISDEDILNKGQSEGPAPESDKESSPGGETSLAEGIPHRDHLVAGGVTSMESLAEIINAGTLTDIDQIAAGRARQIKNWMKANWPS